MLNRILGYKTLSLIYWIVPSAVVVYRILKPYDRLRYNYCIGLGSLLSWAMVINERTNPRVKT